MNCCNGIADWHEADCTSSGPEVAALRDLLADTTPPGSTVFIVEGETYTGDVAGGCCDGEEVIGYLGGDRYVVLDAEGTARIREIG